jgi:hypothetical protein
MAQRFGGYCMTSIYFTRSDRLQIIRLLQERCKVRILLHHTLNLSKAISNHTLFLIHNYKAYSRCEDQICRRHRRYVG